MPAYFSFYASEMLQSKSNAATTTATQTYIFSHGTLKLNYKIIPYTIHIIYYDNSQNKRKKVKIKLFYEKILVLVLCL